MLICYPADPEIDFSGEPVSFCHGRVSTWKFFWVMQILFFDPKIKKPLKEFRECNVTIQSIESTAFVSPNVRWYHCATCVLSVWMCIWNFVIYRGDWSSIKFCEKNSFWKLFLFSENTCQYLGGISQDISVSHFDSRRSLSSANRRQIVGDLPGRFFLSALLSLVICAMARTSCARL